MEDMVDVQVVYILAGDDIYFFVPVFVQIKQRIKLLLLMACQFRKILQDDFGAHGRLNVVALVFHHLKHQLARAMQLSFYCSQRSFQFNGNFFV